MKRRTIALVAAALLVVAGALLISLGVLPSPLTFGVHVRTSFTLDADHPAVQKFKSALETGRLFQEDFPMVTPKLEGEKLPAYLEERRAGRKQLAARYPAGTEFLFIAGREFRVAQLRDSGGCVMDAITEQGEDLNHPSVFQLPGSYSNQIYLLYSGKAPKGYTDHIHMLVARVDGEWLAWGIQIYPGEVCGETAEKLCKSARLERRSGNRILAAALHAAAATLARSPPWRQTGVQRESFAALKEIAAEIGLPAKPVDTVITSDGPLDIHEVVGEVLVEGPCVKLHRNVSKLESEETMMARQKRIAEAFALKHPEFKRYFKHIVVGEASTDPADGGRGYRSVHSFP